MSVFSDISVSLNEIQCVATRCFFEAYAKFILHNDIQIREYSADVILLNDEMYI